MVVYLVIPVFAEDVIINTAYAAYDNVISFF